MSRRRPWFLRSRRAAIVASVLLVADLAAGVASASAAFATPAQPSLSAQADTSSAATVDWSTDRSTLDPGEASDPNAALFQNLAVTVSQTQDLTDQGVTVSWTGGQATSPQNGSYDYLQIMQCWGDSSGPTPQQCEWGEPNATISPLVGANAAGRSLTTGSRQDPNQSYGSGYETFTQFGGVQVPTYSVPFDSVDGSSSFDPSTYFSPANSNEVTLARTAQDGTGTYVFTLQSALTAPWLGCGSPVTANGQTTARSCWLVVVPRGEYSVDGSKADGSMVYGSPLSASAWQDRIQVPLGFSLIGANCKLGAAEERTAGSELVAGAFTSWQSSLCGLGTTYGYSEIGDAEARNSIVAGNPSDPKLDFVSNPVDPAQATGQTLQYAPMSESAIVVAYNIDQDYPDPSSPEYGQNGNPVTNLVLTPRLVAKLLTQSYRVDVPGALVNSSILPNNPNSIRNDPEFLALNPEFKDFPVDAAPDGLIVPIGDSDVASEVWAWLRSDPDARAFLEGKPDPWGMTINPAYLPLNLGTDTSVNYFPKADETTFKVTSDPSEPGYGTLNLRPYADDLSDAANDAVTANADVQTIWDPLKVPPTYDTAGAQVPGRRFELALTTSDDAQLAGLDTASLVDAAGTPVAATADAMNTATLGMQPSTAEPSVLEADPALENRIVGAYPLTMMTYAVVNVCQASDADLTAYATLLGYAAGAGETQGTAPGDLPFGYVPLDADMVAQTKAAATALTAEVKDPQCSSHQQSTTPTTAPTTPQGGSGTVVPPPAAPPATGPGTTTTTPGDVSTSPPSIQVVTRLRMLPVASITSAQRYGLLAGFFFALPCLVVGPVLLRAARRGNP